MITLSAHDGLVTVINPFRVAPEQQEDAIARLIAVNQAMSRHDGFVSASVHRSLDGTRVTNYAQWKSPALVVAALRSPEMQPLLHDLTRVAQGDWHLYEVAHCQAS